MKKLLLLLLTLFTVPSSYALTLTVGTSPQNPPFASLADDNGNFFGFDIDIMMAICKRIKAVCNFKPFTLSEMWGELQNHTIDVAISAIIITPQRASNFLFSLPYMESNAQFLSLQQSNIHFPKDIESKTVGTRLGTPFKELALLLYKNKIISKEFAIVADLLEALKKGDVDVIFINEEAAKFIAANTDGLFRLVGSRIPIGDGYAVMASKGSEALIAQINQALLSMEEDGTYLQIYSNYFN